MKIEDPAATCAARVPASPEVVAMATELVREFAECFWFWHPEARARYVDDVRLVVEHLRVFACETLAVGLAQHLPVHFASL